MYPVVSAEGFLEMGSIGGLAIMATSSYLSKVWAEQYPVLSGEKAL